MSCIQIKAKDLRHFLFNFSHLCVSRKQTRLHVSWVSQATCKSGPGGDNAPEALCQLPNTPEED